MRASGVWGLSSNCPQICTLELLGFSGAGSSGPWAGRGQRARALCGVKRVNTSGAPPGKDKSLFSFPLGLVGARLSLTQAGRFELIN